MPLGKPGNRSRLDRALLHCCHNSIKECHSSQDISLNLSTGPRASRPQ
jgi:hypothetical protein